MIDFTRVHSREIALKSLVDQIAVRPSDLEPLTNEMVDHLLALIAHCTDADVTFVPSDPLADDPYAASPELVDLAWTLGHVIVHTTASAEESAFLAAELARGAQVRPGRSRYEVPWATATSIQQCRERLEESRRMRLATLQVWPDAPHLENTYEPRPGTVHNCVSRFVAGLAHDDSHLNQIEKIVGQAHAARAG
jgi:hypothetical protein